MTLDVFAVHDFGDRRPVGPLASLEELCAALSAEFSNQQMTPRLTDALAARIAQLKPEGIDVRWSVDDSGNVTIRDSANDPPPEHPVANAVRVIRDAIRGLSWDDQYSALSLLVADLGWPAGVYPAASSNFEHFGLEREADLSGPSEPRDWKSDG